ncbi:acyl-CoA N-acyltransferase [Coprinellus micaceus]|uniref:Acyl-CoA N-acyltransferase n=1 Tax=Coprinellus micaceus TaxID=71717 RepID=A0A4Y7STL6_COPMI|nr:acyl-CoA N-acyltransferase [Coprinellus micaceus]
MTDPQSSFDLKFCFPVPDVLESDRVKLVPFVPSLHAQAFVDATWPYPELFQNGGWGPFHDVKSVEELVEAYFTKDPGWLLFAVFDKTRPSSGNSDTEVMAGQVALINTSPINLCTEIGAVLVFPPFQRTHVASNAIGLLLKYTLNLPSHPSFPGLGLRRVVWQANYLNTGSVRIARRLGFQMEGILRWDRVLPLGKGRAVSNGKAGREGDPRAGCLGRDTALFGLCWDDWENGGRQKVEGEMTRER